jgi:Di-haem cytochrome c peroxidase
MNRSFTNGLLRMTSIIIFGVWIAWFPSMNRINAETIDETEPSAVSPAVADIDYRQPIDLQLSPDEKRLAIACKKTGMVVVLDLDTRSVVQKLALGQELHDLESVSEGRLACVDLAANRVHICRWVDGQLRQETSFATSTSPVRAEWVAEQNTLRVACLWSRRIESFDLSDSDSKARKIASWDLPIAPRAMRTLADSDAVLVADAFSPQLCILKASDGKINANHTLYGHAITNIERDGKDQIAMLHPMLNDFAQTNQNDIHWGVLMANDLRWVGTNELLKNAGDDIYVGGRVHPVGVPGNGAGEPTSLALGQGDYIAITVGGTNQLAIGRRDGYTFTYVDVGRYPISCVMSRDGQRCFVANQFDDSVCVVNLKEGKLADTILLGAIRTLSEEERGERLFHSAEFSHDRWMTCASCHVEGHTNGQLNDNLGDRTYGAPKRVLTLLGVGDTHPYSWLGHEATIEKQVVRSILKTMQSYRTIDPDEMKQLAAYCASLPPPPSIRQARGVAEDAVTELGRNLFTSKGCIDCHSAPKFTSSDVYDVGMKDEKGAGQFNPPSLLGVSQRGPAYFHDNRADGLKSVLADHPRKPGQQKLTEAETAALIAYLETL